MRKLFRLIYPVLIYTIIGNVLVKGVYFVYYFIAAGLDTYNPASAAANRADKQVVYWTALAAVITSMILFRFYKKDCLMRGRRPDKIGDSIGVLPYTLLLGPAACLLGNYLIELFGISELSSGFEEVSQTLYSIPLVAQFLCLGIFIPIVEEFVFRILGFRRLRDYMGLVPAALISAVLFGLYHGNLVQAIYASLLGFIMALAYEYCDSFTVPIMIHISANITTVLLTALPGIGGRSLGVMAAVVVVSLAVTVIVLRRMRSASLE